MKINKYLPLIILILILLFGAFFRLYRIREYMTFLGDEGRDVLVVKRMLVDHKITLLGPITSVGSMYMGPIYYYFMIPFLWIWNFDPVGPAIMVALFSIFTIFLIYKIGDEFLGNKAVGLLSAALYAISPLAIIYGRSSWNPNIVPFFSSLIIYSLLKIIIKSEHKWIIIAALSLGILLQLHYVTFMFFPIILGTFLVFRPKILLKYYIVAVFGFLLTYSPFLLFELRHQFVNLNAVWHFFWQQKNESPINFYSIWHTINDVTVRLFWRLIIIFSAEFTKLFILFLSLLLFLSFKMNIKKEIKKSLTLILLWLIIGILSYGLYRGVIYDYYFGSLFAAPFLLTGYVLYFLGKHYDFGKALSIILFVLLSFFSFQMSPLRILPNNLLENTKAIARFVYDKTGNKQYNFALIAGRNSDHAYRYFLELWGNPPVTIENPVNDPDRNSVTPQLLIICEEKICQPLGHPLWEIAGFGRAEIENVWDVSTAKVFRLVHLNKI